MATDNNIFLLFSLAPSNWSAILVLIACGSVLGTAIFLERIWYLKKSETDTNNLIIQLRKAIKEGNIIAAIQICEDSPGSISTIIKAGLNRFSKGRAQVQSAMEVCGMLEIARLEKNAKVLSILAHITPLIGLLGTVLGFITAFSEMRQSGMTDISASAIGEALEYALITTAAGLSVAIPAVVGYNYLVSRIEGFVLEIQATSSEILHLLNETPDPLAACTY